MAMFGRNKGDDVDTKPQNELGPERMVAPLNLGTARTGAPSSLSAAPVTPQRPPAMPARPQMPEMPTSQPQGLRLPPETPRGETASSPPPQAAEREMRQLIVGRDISLSGEISSCDRLIVEGSVDTHLSGCHDITITETGLFKGSATIDVAEIRGRFEGTISVTQRLFIRSTGTVTGTIRYGQLEIECGGRLIGDVQVRDQESKSDTSEVRRERSNQPVIEIGSTQII